LREIVVAVNEICVLGLQGQKICNRNIVRSVTQSAGIALTKQLLQIKTSIKCKVAIAIQTNVPFQIRVRFNSCRAMAAARSLAEIFRFRIELDLIRAEPWQQRVPL